MTNTPNTTDGNQVQDSTKKVRKERADKGKKRGPRNPKDSV